jgi:large conductance mechanosensitive channel
MAKAKKKTLQAGEENEALETLRRVNKEMKKRRDGFFKDFKKFITRGNVLDMAVGVIVGGAFTAIINGLSNNILKPIINWILALVLGKDSLSEVFTFLKRVDVQQDVLDEAGNKIGTQMVPDLAESIYIDWGAFINAVINFLLIAFTLFVIVRIINGVRAKLDAKEIEAAAKEKAEAEAKAKAEADAAAAAAAAEVARKEQELQDFYANVARQTALLEQLAKK